MSDWRIPGDPNPGEPESFDADAFSPADPTAEGFADPAFADPFSDEVAAADGADWDVDLLWGPAPIDDGGDLDLPL